MLADRLPYLDVASIVQKNLMWVDIVVMGSQISLMKLAVNLDFQRALTVFVKTAIVSLLQEYAIPNLVDRVFTQLI
jgi:hypothetical protein